MMEYKDVVYLAGHPYDGHVPDVRYGHRITRHFFTLRPDITYEYFGMRHKVDGPAEIELESGIIKFLVNGTHCRYTKMFCQTAGMSGEDTLMWVLRFGDELPTTCEEYYGEDWESIPIEDF